MFKEDDRIIVVGDHRFNAAKGERGIITRVRIDNPFPYMVALDGNFRGFLFRDSELIKESIMSKYDELKSRIENVEGWDKEADDIIQEIGREYEIQFEQDATSRYGSMTIWRRSYSDDKGYFKYTSQCDKLEAFKKALMWLLDHSDIKKTIVGTEVKADIEGKTYKVRILEKL